MTYDQVVDAVEVLVEKLGLPWNEWATPEKPFRVTFSESTVLDGGDDLFVKVFSTKKEALKFMGQMVKSFRPLSSREVWTEWVIYDHSGKKDDEAGVLVCEGVCTPIK